MYYFRIELDIPMDQAVEKVTKALANEGFGILADMDVQATLKKKLGVDRGPYRILGACNPPLAKQALEAEPDIGVLLPCNVVVRETGPGRVAVSFMDPKAVLSLVGEEKVGELAAEVRSRLQRVRDVLSEG